MKGNDNVYLHEKSHRSPRTKSKLTNVKLPFKGISNQFLESMKGNRFAIITTIVTAAGPYLSGFLTSLATALAVEAITGNNEKKG